MPVSRVRSRLPAGDLLACGGDDENPVVERPDGLPLATLSGMINILSDWSDKGSEDGACGTGDWFGEERDSMRGRWAVWHRAGPRPWPRSGIAIVVAAMTVTSLLVGATAPAAGSNGGDIRMVDLVSSEDIDGDGWASTFTVEVEADTTISEQGGLGKGEPVLSVWGELENGEYVYLGGKRVGRDDGVWQIPIDGESVSERHVLVRPRFQSLEVRLSDSDSGASWLPGILGANAAVPLDTQRLVVEEIPFENSNTDRAERVLVSSNVSGATVTVDGDTIGTTPATAEMPVDLASRSGPTTITVSKRGYHTETVTTEVTPPDTVSVPLQKVRKPVVVSSQPAGATVLVDGQEVGTTPYVGQYWVGREVDVEVRAEGYLTQSYTDVSSEAGVHAELTPIVSVGPPTFDPGVLLNSTATATPTPQSGAVDYGQLDDTAVVTGTDTATFDHASYLDSIAPQYDSLPPVLTASFDTGPTDPVAGTAVTVDAADSYGLTAPITRYEWDFDDGTTTTGETARHIYADPGSYDVTLRVTTEDGQAAATTRRITVKDRPPVAQFGYDTVRPEAGSPVSLDDGPSADPEGRLAAYEWRLGDGTTLTGETVSHVYDSPGTYDVELTVRDVTGTADTDTRQITVVTPNTPPVAAFGASASTLARGESVSFDAGSSKDDGAIRTYAWQFGDGVDATGQTVSHSYTESGTYEVTLTVFDDRGETATETRRVTVVADAQADTTATDGPATRAAGTTTAAGTDTPPETTGGGPGFGALAAAAALALTVLVAWRRRR